MRADLAERLQLTRISDLAAHPELRLGFSEEFLARADGWPALQARYQLPHKDVRGLDHDLAWRGLQSGSLDVIDAYTTDAEILYYKPRLLADDRRFFTEYVALVLYRESVSEPARERLRGLEGRIPQGEMIAMNARAKVDKVPEATIAAEWLTAHFGTRAGAHGDGLWRRVGRRTGSTSCWWRSRWAARSCSASRSASRRRAFAASAS